MQATATFPYWNRQTQTLESGVYCRACTYHLEEGKADEWRRKETIRHPYPPSREAYHRAFLEADLPEHFIKCSAIKKDYDFCSRNLGDGFRRDGTDFIVRPNV